MVPPTHHAAVCPAPQSVEGGSRPSPLAVFLEVATLIFLAEWGDRWEGGGDMRGAIQTALGPRGAKLPYWSDRNGNK